MFMLLFCENYHVFLTRCSKNGTDSLASRQTFHRDAGQTGWKTGCPGGNGTGGNPRCT